MLPAIGFDSNSFSLAIRIERRAGTAAHSSREFAPPPLAYDISAESLGEC
jgi:hypothetical protein